MPILTVTYYRLVCPICRIDYDDGDKVPHFSTKQEAEEYVEPFEGEPLERAIVRKCRNLGCGVKAWDRMHPRLAKKLQESK